MLYFCFDSIQGRFLFLILLWFYFIFVAGIELELKDNNKYIHISICNLLDVISEKVLDNIKSLTFNF